MSDLLRSYRFREEREADWHKLDKILTRASNRGVSSLSDEDMQALPRLYRQAVSSLSVARAISLDQNVVNYLESLCTRAYFFVYGTRTRLSARIGEFFSRDWPRVVSNAWKQVLLSALCLFGAWAFAFYLCMQDMEWYWTFHGGTFDPRNPNATTDYLRSTLYDSGGGLSDWLAAFAAQLFSHNSQIALFCFALGFAFGIPTALLLIYNGLYIGSFYALFWSRGLGYELTGWLMIHGVTELFAIILAGAAGFLIGGSVAFPGRKSRMSSARQAGQDAAMMAVGAVIMLFIAAILEGFGRQLITSDILRYAIAATSLIVWLSYFFAPKRSRRIAV